VQARLAGVIRAFDGRRVAGPEDRAVKRQEQEVAVGTGGGPPRGVRSRSGIGCRST
jgi:hypothetical protein